MMRSMRMNQRSEEHTSELQSHSDLVCRLLLEKKKQQWTGFSAHKTPRHGKQAPSLAPSCQCGEGAAARWLEPVKAAPVARLAFFFNDTATTEIYTLSLHDAFRSTERSLRNSASSRNCSMTSAGAFCCVRSADRKSTRLNSSHTVISYAVFCLK